MAGANMLSKVTRNYFQIAYCFSSRGFYATTKPKSFSRSFSINNLKTCVAHLQTHQEENDFIRTEQKVTTVENEILLPPRARKRPFKTRTSFLKHLDGKLSPGEVLSVTEGFALLKACGPRMVGETDEARNKLVTYVWQELQKNGVPLDIGLWNTLLSVYVENHHDFEPLEFLKELWEKSSADPNKTTFSLLIQAYAAKGDPAGAMKIVDFMMKNDAQMTEHIYAWLIQAFAKKGDMNGVEEILKSMSDNKIKAKHSTYNALINAHAARGDINEINETVEKMIANKLYPTAETYLSLFDQLARGGHHLLIPVVWEKITDIEYMNNDIQPLVQSCITRGDYKSALQLAICSKPQKSNRMESYIKYIEIKLFNMLLFSEKELSEFVKMSFLVEEHFSTKSRERNLIYYFIDKDKPEMALDALKLLNDDYAVKITTRNFLPIIEYYVTKNDIENIFKVYDTMVTVHGLELDYYCCRALESILGDYGGENFRLVLQKLQERESMGFSYGIVSQMVKNEKFVLEDLSKVVSNASGPDLFSSLHQIKDVLLRDFNPMDAAKVVISLHEKGMKDAGILVDQVVNSKITDGVEKNVSEEVFDFIKLLVENKVPLHSQTYTKALRGLHSTRNSDKFFLFVRLMKENGIEPDAHQYYQMLKMAASVGNSMAAQFCFDKVQASDLFPSRRNESYQMLLIAYSRDNEAAKVVPSYLQEKVSENAHKVCHLFEEMERENFRVSPLCVSLAIKGYLANNEIVSANGVIEKYGYPKRDVGYNVDHAFLQAYINTNDHTAAHEMFEKMKSENKDGIIQYNEMMKMCETTGDVRRMEELYDEIKAKDLKPNVFTYLHRIRTYLANKQPEHCIDILKENVKSGLPLLRVDVFMIVLRHLVPTGNIDNVEQVVDMIKQYHVTKVPPKRLEHAQILVRIKAGQFDEATKLLPKRKDNDNGGDIISEIELNPYRKVAKTASMEGDVDYIRNMSTFLRMNGLHYQTLDTFYLLALNKADDVDGIRHLYNERTNDGVEMTEKFLSILEAIVEDRDLENFMK